MRATPALAGLLLTTLFSVAPASERGTAPDASAWTTTARTEARVVEDSNVFLQDEVPLAAGQTERGVPARADDEELISGVGVTAMHKPTPGGTGGSVELGYVWEWHRFSTWQNESHHDHRLLAVGKWIGPTVIANGRFTLLEVDGGRDTPVFNEVGGVPAMGGEPVRSRRAQTVATAGGSVLWQPVGVAWRLRPNASLLSQDFHTVEGAQPVGCANYVDRGQALAGVDAGRALGAGRTGWLSLRAGRQWQSNLLGREENFTSSIIRPLVGFEGEVTSTVRVNAWAGPSLHAFTHERRAGTESNRTIPYFETTGSWAASPADSLTLSARHHLWPGSGGRSAYRELKAETGWTHRFRHHLETTLRAGLLHGNFGGFAASPRNDNVFTAGGIAALPLPGGLRTECGVTREWSQTQVPHTDGRAYHRWLTSVALSRVW